MITAASTVLPSTPLVVGSDGYVYYGTEAGTLVYLDPADDTVHHVADLSNASAASTSIRGFIEEVRPGEWMGIAFDYDASSNPMRRRLFHVNATSSNVNETDISDLIEDETYYPGVVAYTK